VFKFADTAIAEFIASNYLKKAGFWFDNGTLYKHNIILTGNNADIVIAMIKACTYSKYFIYATLLLVLLYALFILFSKRESIEKAVWIKRILLYPSIVIIFVSIIVLILPSMLIHQSNNVSLVAVYLIRDTLYTVLLYITLPIITVCIILFLCGLVVRKIF